MTEPARITISKPMPSVTSLGKLTVFTSSFDMRISPGRPNADREGLNLAADRDKKLRAFGADVKWAEKNMSIKKRKESEHRLIINGEPAYLYGDWVYSRYLLEDNKVLFDKMENNLGTLQKRQTNELETLITSLSVKYKLDAPRYDAREPDMHPKGEVPYKIGYSVDIRLEPNARDTFSNGDTNVSISVMPIMPSQPAVAIQDSLHGQIGAASSEPLFRFISNLPVSDQYRVLQFIEQCATEAEALVANIAREKVGKENVQESK